MATAADEMIGIEMKQLSESTATPTAEEETETESDKLKPSHTDEMIGIEMKQLSESTATPTAEEETETESDKLKPSHTEGLQEQSEVAFDDTPKIKTHCLQSLCDKLGTTTPTKDFTITKLDFIFHVFSLCTLIADIGTDIWVAVIHYKNDDIWWFALTLAFVFAPSMIFIIIFFSNDDKDLWTFFSALLTSIPGTLIFVLFQDLVYEWKIIKEKDPQEKKKMSKALLGKLNGSSRMRLFEAFLEAAPQLVLQLYIIYSNAGRQGHMGAVQWCSVCISLASLSLPVTTSYKMDRLYYGKYKVSVPGTTLLITFHIFTIGARVLSLAILAVSSGYALLGVTVIHYGVMSVWIFFMINSNICDVGVDKLATIFAFAFIYFFCLFDNLNEYSRLRYAFFYTLTYIENTGILFFWYFYSPPSHDWQRYLACTSIMGGYLIGILCLIVYYVDLHPNNFIGDPKKKKEKEIKVLIPLSKCKLIKDREK